MKLQMLLMNSLLYLEDCHFALNRTELRSFEYITVALLSMVSCDFSYIASHSILLFCKNCNWTYRNEKWQKEIFYSAPSMATLWKIMIPFHIYNIKFVKKEMKSAKKIYLYMLIVAIFTVTKVRVSTWVVIYWVNA